MKNMKDILDHIASVPLFRELAMEHHEDLASILEEKVYKRGELIFSEGDKESIGSKSFKSSADEGPKKAQRCIL
jgi:hypothetical protein